MFRLRNDFEIIIIKSLLSDNIYINQILSNFHRDNSLLLAFLQRVDIHYH